MKRLLRKKLLSILFLSILMTSTLVGCGQSCMLTIFSTSGGNVSVMKAGTATWIGAQGGMSLGPGDTIKTGDNSTAEITFVDGTTIELQAGTEIEVASLACTDTGSTTIVLEQTIGNIVFRVTKIIDAASRYEVQTPTGAAVVRGSMMWVYVIEDGTTWITNLEGDIRAIAQGVELQIPQGQQCIIRPSQPPKPVMVAAGGEHTVGLKKDSTVVAVGDNSAGQCDAGSWTDIIQVSAGDEHTVGLKSNHTVVAVGANISGQCDVGGWTDIIQVSAGGYHTVGIKKDGTVVAVGDNSAGQCDAGSWTDIIQVSAGYFHTVGLKADSTVAAVGLNGSGQCNVGSWADIIQVSAGGEHTVGLKSDGTVVAVGLNDFEECDVSDWTDIIQVSAGFDHTVGLKTDGTVVAVGLNNHGQCDVSGWDLK